MQSHRVEVAVNLVLRTEKTVFKSFLDLTPFPLSEKDKTSELRVRGQKYFCGFFKIFFDLYSAAEGTDNCFTQDITSSSPFLSTLPAYEL